MQVVVIDADGTAREADADVVVLCDRAQGVPIALARVVDQKVEFLTLQDRDIFLTRLRQVVAPEVLDAILKREPEVRRVE